MDLLTFLRTEHGLRASTAILFNHESPLRGPQFVSRKISRAVALAKLGRPVKLELQNLAARVDWSSAHDVVRALHLMGTAANPADYVVASGQLHSVQQMVEFAFSLASTNWRDLLDSRPGRSSPALLGCNKELRETLHWQPTVDFAAMIEEMVEHDYAESALTTG